MSTSLVTTHQPLCKICKSPYRNQIDELLLRRSFREKDEKGLRITAALISKRAADMGIENLKEVNMTSHWKKHCRIVQSGGGEIATSTSEIGTALNAVKTTYEMVVERILSRPLGPDSFADDVIEIAQLKAHETLRNGSLPNITIDQGLKAVDVKTRRRHNEKVVELLDLQAEALTQSLGYEIDAEDAEVVEIVDR
jgi:hypothetical protein